MRILKARLFDIKHKEEEQKLAALRGEQRGKLLGGAVRVRSYVFEPYTMVKDTSYRGGTGRECASCYGR